MNVFVSWIGYHSKLGMDRINAFHLTKKITHVRKNAWYNQKCEKVFRDAGFDRNIGSVPSAAPAKEPESGSGVPNRGDKEDEKGFFERAEVVASFLLQ